ncbi:hypothetical protein ACIQXM_04670 [Arthrobacter sp. NPDC097144]|uniref:hypothetical protein n=1 Tax=Arthrobacter sp. NPDC097144 TaxID=3363946 RepID=UPI0037F5F8E2
MEVVGIRIALQWGHAVLGESLHAYRDARIPVDELWPPDPALDALSGPLDEVPLNKLKRALNHRVFQKTLDPFAENTAVLIRTR